MSATVGMMQMGDGKPRSRPVLKQDSRGTVMRCGRTKRSALMYTGIKRHELTAPVKRSPSYKLSARADRQLAPPMLCNKTRGIVLPCRVERGAAWGMRAGAVFHADSRGRQHRQNGALVGRKCWPCCGTHPTSFEKLQWYQIFVSASFGSIDG